MWLQRVKEQPGEHHLEVEWRPFSLEQVNSKEGPHWKVWEEPPGYASRGLLAFRAGEAARRQGPKAFQRFHLALLAARHEQRLNIADRGVVLDVARKTGLEQERFQEDLEDRSLLALIGESHTRAVEEYGIFGVPTFLFPNGGTAYLKMLQPPDGDVLPVLESLVNIMGRWLYIGEVKRPQPPWPRGTYR